MAFHDEAYANQLWQMSGLADVFRQMSQGGSQTAVGLNPNIRLYKYVVLSLLMNPTAVCQDA